MKSIVAIVIICLTTFCATQSFGDLPQCAIQCVGNSIPSTGCSMLDVNCICKSSGWIAGLSCCISQGCPPADQQTTIQFADQLCKADDVTLPNSASCAASLSTTATGSGSPSGASATTPTTGSSGVSSVAGTASSTTSLSGAAATGSTGSTAATTSTASAASTSGASSANSAASTASVASTASAASAASATPSAGAASNHVDSGVGMAVMAVAVLALL